MTTARSSLGTGRIAIACLALITAWLPLRPAAALVPLASQPPHFQMRFECDDPTPGACPAAEADAQLVAGFLETSWEAFEAMGVRLPEDRLPVRLKNRRSDCDCTSPLPVSGCATGALAINGAAYIRFNMDQRGFCSNTQLANTAAHELAHSVQYEYLLDHFADSVLATLIFGPASAIDTALYLTTSQNQYEVQSFLEGWPSAMAMLVNANDSANPPFQGDLTALLYLSRYLLWAQPALADGNTIAYPHDYVLPWRLQAEGIENTPLETIESAGYYAGALWMHIAQRIGTPPLNTATGIIAGSVFSDMLESISTEIADETSSDDFGIDIGAGIDNFIDEELGMTRLEFLQDMSFAWAIERFGDPTPTGSLSPGLAIQRRSNELFPNEVQCNLSSQFNLDAPTWLVRHPDAAPPGPAGAPVEDAVDGEFVDRHNADDLLTGRTQFWSFDTRTRVGADHPLRPLDAPSSESPMHRLNVPPFAVSVRTASETPAEWQARAFGGHSCDDDDWITPVLSVSNTLQTIPNDLRFTDYAFLMNSRRNGLSAAETPAEPGGPSSEEYDEVWGGASEGPGVLEFRYDFAPDDAWLPLNGTLWSAPGAGRWTTLSIDASEAGGPVGFLEGRSPVLRDPESDEKARGLPDATAHPRSQAADPAKTEAVIVDKDEKAKTTAEANSFGNTPGSADPKGGKQTAGSSIKAVGLGDVTPRTAAVTVMVTDDQVHEGDVGVPRGYAVSVPWVFAEVTNPLDFDEERLPQPFDIVGRVERIDPEGTSRQREWDTLNPSPYRITVDVDHLIATSNVDRYGLATRMAVLGLPLDGRGDFSEVSAHRVDIMPVQGTDGRGGETYFVTGYAGDLVEEEISELIVQDTWLTFTELNCGYDDEVDTATAVVTAWVTNQGSEEAPRVCVDFDFSGSGPVVTACAENEAGSVPLLPARTLGINATHELSFDGIGWVSGNVHAWTLGPEAIETNNLDAFAGSINCPFGKAPVETFEHDQIFDWVNDQQFYRKMLDRQEEIAEQEAAIFIRQLLDWLLGPDVEPPVHRYFGPEYARFHGLVNALEPLVAAGFTKPEIAQHLARLGLSPGELLGASTDQLRVLGDAAVEDAFFQSRLRDQKAQPKQNQEISWRAMPGGVLGIGPRGELEVHAPQQQGYAVVDLEGFDSGDVWFDGRFTGFDAGQMPLLVVPPGVHEVVVTHPSGMEAIASLCTQFERGSKARLDRSTHCDLDANANQRQLRPQLELIEALEAHVAKRAPDALAAAKATENDLDSIQEEFQLRDHRCAPECAIGSFALSRRLEDATQTARRLTNPRPR